ncbi:hypothetical protein Vau01_080760 [Virgisporangium aurantiacum]|uniref:TerD domain-containing protein n=1 Tax=Virgisporangium aurantiacum TaxID=175570 RepID=A0A8J3ZFB2_9ACTN|nr:hypothetical protein Vau01_080760 [Virgisporangium aurantiacum]
MAWAAKLTVANACVPEGSPVSKQFTKGQKSQLSALTAGTDLYVGIQLNAPGTSWDISCFGLDVNNKLSDDRYMIFYNQPKSPDGSIERLGEQSGDNDSFRVNLGAVPKSIGRLSFCAAIDGNGNAGQIQSGYLRIVAGGAEVARFAFAGSDFKTERGLIIADLYLKDVWRFGAVGQGFDGGLADLIRDFGGQVEEEEEAPKPAGPAPGFAPPPGGPAPGFAPPPGPPPGQPAPGFAPPPGPPPGQPAPGFAPPPGQPAQPAYAAPPPPAQTGFAPPPGGQPGYAQPGQAPGQQPGYGQPAAGGYGAPPAAAGYGPEMLPSQAQPVQPGAMNSLNQYRELTQTGRWVRQNSKLVKVTLGPEAVARRGSMVAYQGDIDFDHRGSGGIRGRIESAMTGQGLKLMSIKGIGEVFLAEDAADLHVVELNGQQLCVNANNVLAFDATLQTEVRRIESPGLPGGGMFHLQVGGQGTVVVMTHGYPLTLNVQGPTFADMNAVVAWTAGMRVSVSTTVRVSREVYHGASGESVALQFMGMQGHFVVVQPYEV